LKEIEAGSKKDEDEAFKNFFMANVDENRI